MFLGLFFTEAMDKIGRENGFETVLANPFAKSPDFLVIPAFRARGVFFQYIFRGNSGSSHLGSL